MLRFAADGILSFSAVPLRLATWLGLLASGFAGLGVVYVLAVRLLTDAWVAGWAMQSIVTLFLGGVQLVLIGVFGEYLGRIYIEVKRRPLYLVRERIGFPSDADPKDPVTERRHSGGDRQDGSRVLYWCHMAWQPVVKPRVAPRVARRPPD